jgi:hypothetical protein
VGTNELKAAEHMAKNIYIPCIGIVYNMSEKENEMKKKTSERYSHFRFDS